MARAARPGRRRTRSARRCRSSITCRTARRIIATSTASISRSMRWPPPGSSVEALGAPRRRRNCGAACTGLPNAPASAGRGRRPSGADRGPAAVAWKSPSSSALARHFVGLLRTRDPLSERVHLGKLGVAGVGLLGVAKGLLTGRLGRRRTRQRRQQIAADERRQHTTETTAAPARPAAPRAARSTRRCASCRARSARRCSRSIRSAARSTTSPTTGAARRARLGSSTQWRARHRRALCRASRRRICAGSRRRCATSSSAAARISSP